MSEKMFMAVDLGTSFIKSGVYTLEGRCLAAWSEPVRDERPAPGIFIQRGEMLYASVCSCMRQTARMLGDQAKAVSGIAFTGQMAGAMGVDENWNDITTWSCSLDGRYLPYAQRQQEQYGGDFFEIGGTVSPVMCSKYDWFRSEFPEEHKKIAKYVMLNGYIIGRLSKIPVEEARIDYSLITWTGLADIRGRRWSDKICGELGISKELLPEIVSCTAVGGYLDPGVAKELSLPPGIPLIVGAGDKVSGCTGAGISRDGELIFEAASYGAVSCRVSEARMDSRYRSYDMIGSADDRSFYAHKYIQGSGITIDWFVDEFIRQAKEPQKDAFSRIDVLASEVPAGSEGMLAVGLLGGSAMPFDSELRGIFAGHTWSHRKGHFYRALLEGFTYDLKLTLESIERQYPEAAGVPVKLIGGGARSLVWPQMLADVTGHPFEALEREDAALWGAALLAAAGAGEIRNPEEAAKASIKIKKTYYPDTQRHEQYMPYVRLYQTCTLQMHGLCKELNRLR